MTNIMEYLACGLVLILIFSAIAYMLVWVLDPVQEAENRQDVQSTAENLLTNLLGYSGYPPQWGSDLTINTTTLRGLGLAKASTDDTALNLDIDKITRLSDSSVGTYMGVDVVRRLANLQYQYDFNLEFIPVLNITIIPTKTFTTNKGKILESAFKFIVTTHEQIRVANVNLTGYIMTPQLVQNQSGDFVNFTLVAVKSTVTDWKGEASLNYSIEMRGLINVNLVGAVLFVRGNYYGLRTIAIRMSQSSQDMMPATIVGDYFILGIQPQEIVQGTTQSQQVVEGTLDCIAETSFQNSTDSVNHEAPWVIHYASKNYKVYELDYMEPDIYFIGLVVKYSNTFWLAVALRVPHGMIGNNIPSGSEVADVRRLVLIDGYTYYADLHLWKVSWS
jgi:hypothetical protein